MIKMGEWYRWKNEGWHKDLLPNNKLSQGYPVEVWAILRGYVIAAHTGCTPYVFSEKDFLEKFELIQQPSLLESLHSTILQPNIQTACHTIANADESCLLTCL